MCIRDRPQGINNLGVITGTYVNAKGVFHGFVRAADGIITAFDPEGSKGTQAYVVNDKGTITGGYLDGKGPTNYIGFVRSPDGKITIFDPHKSGWVLELGINNHGAITGGYAKSYTQGVQRGFLLTTE